MKKQTRSTSTARLASLPALGRDLSGPAALPGSAVPLAFLPIDVIAPQPIEYLCRCGVPIHRYAYQALSDIGLGSPVIRYRIEHGDQRPPTTLIAKWHE